MTVGKHFTKTSLLTYDNVNSKVSYDSVTGKLFWKERPVENKWTWKFNERFAGKEALITVDKAGYLYGSIDRIKVKAHRIAWLPYYGEWPNVVDHINGIKSDNRICNLRSVTTAENNMNKSFASNNKSGKVGVGLMKGNRWRAHIKKNGKFYHLGSFDTFEEAVECRRYAEIDFWGYMIDG